MTIKTPQEIAAEQMRAFTVDDGDVRECSAAFIEQAIAEAIKDDRAQRALDVDGDTMDPLMSAIAEALDERGSYGDADDARANKAAAAVRGEGGYSDVIFDTFVAGLLSTLEQVYGDESDARECSRCGDEVGYLDSRDECDSCNNATRCPNCDEDTDEEDGRDAFKNWCRSCVHNAERSA